MDKISTQRKQHAQKKYRQSQANKRLVRFELQVSAETKVRFDALVAAAAEEYATPWDPRRRLALARAQVFDEITQGTTHEFFALKDQIHALNAEIKALSPQFFKKRSESTPLPRALQALQADVPQLKQMIAGLLQENQQLTKERHKWEECATRNEKLYEAMSDYNDTLKATLRQQDIPVE